MRFSKSNDGVLRTNIRIEHRMGRDDLIDAIAAEIASFHVVDDLPEKMGEAKLMEMVKNTLTYRPSYQEWDADYSQADEVREWVTRQVDRVWGKDFTNTTKRTQR